MDTRDTLHLLARQVARFGVVGIVAFIVDVGVFNILILTVLEEKPLTAKVFSSLLAIAVAYTGNRSWTFHPDKQPGSVAGAGAHHHSIPRQFFYFMMANGIAMLASLACLGFSRYALGLDSPIADNISANIIGIGLGTVIRFYLYRTWVFPEPEQTREGRPADVSL